MNVYEVIQRGYDTSGRPLRNTRLKWAAFDRINGIVGGWLVNVQGAFMGGGSAAASADTHELGGCNDVRRWNHDSKQAVLVIEVANEVGDIYFERFAWQGFDPHYHNLLANDKPLSQGAANQVIYFNRGENALASHGPDPHKRPSRPLPLFTFEEDDMFEDADRTRLVSVEKQLGKLLERVDAGFTNERERDANQRVKDRERNREQTKAMAALRDQQGLMLNQLKDDDSPSAREVKRMLKVSNAQLVEQLRLAESTDGTEDDAPDEVVDQHKALVEEG